MHKILLIFILFPSLAFSKDCFEILEKELCYNQYFESVGEIEVLLKRGEDKYYAGEIEDLNSDNLSEILLVGNGCNKNCDMVLITKESKGYRVIGRFGGLYQGPAKIPEAVAFDKETSTQHKGYKNILVHNQSGWGEGSKNYYMFDGKSYRLVVSSHYYYNGFPQ
jgi:hypothetical protein